MAAPKKPTVRELAKGTRLGFVLENFGGATSGARPARSRIDPLLTATGLYMVGQIQRAFADQRRGHHLWRKRAVPNIIGGVVDLNQGQRPKSRRFESRPALIDTGLLRGSISYRRLTDGTVGIEVGTTVPYATIHQLGGPTEEIAITDRARETIEKLLGAARKRASGERQMRMSKKEKAAGPEGERAFTQRKARQGVLDANLKPWAFLLDREENGMWKVESISTEVPSRPFVKILGRDVEAIREMAAAWILRDTGRSGTPWLGGTP